MTFLIPQYALPTYIELIAKQYVNTQLSVPNNDTLFMR